MDKGFQQSSFLIFLKDYINATMPAPARNGLGLAITKELVSAHKGIITAESILDKGTKFIISLPKNKITR